VQRALLFLSLLLWAPACALAFTPGVSPAPTPAKFTDSENASLNEERRTELAHADSVPAFGMSFVVGGVPMDSGTLPKPPLPVVILP
jgi:hypothetical protein